MSDSLHVIQAYCLSLPFSHRKWIKMKNYLDWKMSNLIFFLPPLRQLTRGWTLMMKSEMWSIRLSHFISWLLPAMSNNLTIFQKLKNNKRRLISLRTLWLVVVSSGKQLQTKIRLYCTDFTRLNCASASGSGSDGVISQYLISCLYFST